MLKEESDRKAGTGTCTHELGKQKEERNGVLHIVKVRKDVRKTRGWREEGAVSLLGWAVGFSSQRGGGRCVAGMTVQCPGR